MSEGGKFLVPDLGAVAELTLTVVVALMSAFVVPELPLTVV